MNTMAKLGMLVAATAVMAGCAAVGPKISADCPTPASPGQAIKSCTQGGTGCGTFVEVVPDGAHGCQVVVNANVIHVTKNAAMPNASTRITWELRTPAWEFRVEEQPFAAPIIFVSKPGYDVSTAPKQFSPPTVSENGKKVTIVNGPVDGKTYPYTIRVFRNGASGGGLNSSDPAIFNDF